MRKFGPRRSWSSAPCSSPWRRCLHWGNGGPAARINGQRLYHCLFTPRFCHAFLPAGNLAFSICLSLFLGYGMITAEYEANVWLSLMDTIHHLVLPAATLGIILIGPYSRLSRASMLEVIGSDYIRTARAKGLLEDKIIFKHALRNAILPILTMAGLQLGLLLAGAVLVETVFSCPGMGRLMFDGILRRDYPLIMGSCFSLPLW